jgi:hypothetical protein
MCTDSSLEHLISSCSEARRDLVLKPNCRNLHAGLDATPAIHSPSVGQLGQPKARSLALSEPLPLLRKVLFGATSAAKLGGMTAKQLVQERLPRWSEEQAQRALHAAEDVLTSDDSPTSARDRLRARAAALGILSDVNADAPQIGEEERERIIASTRGIGPIADRLIAEGRSL